MASSVRKVRAKLREFALSLPESSEDLPWGERVTKVKKKVFVFLGRDMDAHFGLGVKLTKSNKSALALEATAPMGYGLGKSGWVSARFEAGATPTFDLLRDWVLESYCAVAPKSLAARVREDESTAPTARSKAKSTQEKRSKRVRKVSARVGAKSKPAPRRVSATKRTPKP
ncbi:MAG TPA: MmcQ/YjbR family DNA-binding protein [Polyangiaceae bacterium]|nr:MmcQ/YjbR family DNA-binding protein [Polyangiaceae bacterium]